MKNEMIRGIILATVAAVVGLIGGTYVGKSAARLTNGTTITPATQDAEDGVAVYRRRGWTAGARGKTLSDSRPWQSLTKATDEELRSWDAGWTQGAAEYLMNREKDRLPQRKEQR